MKHHSELINWLIKERDLKSYIEIGVFNRDHNFNKICAYHKRCVDPDPSAKADYQMTSDDFFEHWIDMPQPKTDLIFIDGLHHADQVEKDFHNALKILTNRGFIVMHDCNPHSERITHVPRDNREWCGDVYKFAARLGEIDGIDYCTIDADYGCAVVWKAWWKKGKPVGKITWERFVKERKELLKLVPFSYLENILNMSKVEEQQLDLP